MGSRFELMISARARCSSASKRAIAGSFRSCESFVNERDRAVGIAGPSLSLGQRDLQEAVEQ